MKFNPCIPKDWKNYKIQYKWKESVYNIEVKNLTGKEKEVNKIILDGNIVENKIKLDGSRKIYNIEVIM